MSTSSSSDKADKVVNVYRARCPQCDNHTRLKTTASNDLGDGSRAQNKRCLHCGHKFLLILN